MASSSSKDASEEMKSLQEVAEKQQHVIETLKNLNIHKTREMNELREELSEYEECCIGIMEEVHQIEKGCCHLKLKWVTVSEDNTVLRGEVEEFKDEASANFRHLMIEKLKNMVLQQKLEKMESRLLESNRQLFNARAALFCGKLECYCSDSGRPTTSTPAQLPHGGQANKDGDYGNCHVTDRLVEDAYQNICVVNADVV